MDVLTQLRDNIQRVFFGHQRAVDESIICLLARGHLLIEDVPGVGKTVLAQALARSIDCQFNRLQMTPDLIPADILGLTVYQRENEAFVFKPGPVFTNILLADEVNRTTPRTQSALLEAMNEAQVSIDSQTHDLPRPFLVIATQNPYEHEGTFTLPESQLDRFLMRIHLGYPSGEDEGRILLERPAAGALQTIKPVLTKEQVLELQTKVDEVKIDKSLVDYIVALGQASRENDQVALGVSPRGTLALAQVARASALYQGRDYVVPDDIVNHAPAAFNHRLVLHQYGSNTTEASMRVVDQIMQSVGVPG